MYAFLSTKKLLLLQRSIVVVSSCDDLPCEMILSSVTSGLLTSALSSQRNKKWFVRNIV